MFQSTVPRTGAPNGRKSKMYWTPTSYAFNLELIVLRTDNQLQHYWRENYVWYEGPIIVVNG